MAGQGNYDFPMEDLRNTLYTYIHTGKKQALKRMIDAFLRDLPDHSELNNIRKCCSGTIITKGVHRYPNNQKIYIPEYYVLGSFSIHTATTTDKYIILHDQEVSVINKQATDRNSVWLPFLMSFKNSEMMMDISKHPLFTKDILAGIMKLSVDPLGNNFLPLRIMVHKIDCSVDNRWLYLGSYWFSDFFTKSIIESINSTQHICANNCRLSQFVPKLNKIVFNYINLVCSTIKTLPQQEQIKIMVDDNKQGNFVYCENGITYSDGSYVSNPHNFKIHSTAFVQQNLHCVFSLNRSGHQNHQVFNNHKVYCFDKYGKVVISELYTLIPQMLKGILEMNT